MLITGNCDNGKGKRDRVFAIWQRNRRESTPVGLLPGTWRPIAGWQSKAGQSFDRQ